MSPSRSGDLHEGVDGRLGDLRELAGRPAGHLQDGVVRIAQAGQKRPEESGGAVVVVTPASTWLVRVAEPSRAGQDLQCPLSDGRCRVGQARRQLVGRRPVGPVGTGDPVQGAEGSCPDGCRRVGQEVTCRPGAAVVAAEERSESVP